jgi:hypothetical protein
MLHLTENRVEAGMIWLGDESESGRMTKSTSFIFPPSAFRFLPASLLFSRLFSPFGSEREN